MLIKTLIMPYEEKVWKKGRMSQKQTFLYPFHPFIYTFVKLSSHRIFSITTSVKNKDQNHLFHLSGPNTYKDNLNTPFFLIL